MVKKVVLTFKVQNEILLRQVDELSAWHTSDGNVFQHFSPFIAWIQKNLLIPIGVVIITASPFKKKVI